MSTAHLGSYLFNKNKEIVNDLGVVAYFPFDSNYNDSLSGLSPLIPITDNLIKDGYFNKALLVHDVDVAQGITVLNTPRYIIPYQMKTISFWFKMIGAKVMLGTPRTIFCIEPNSETAIRLYQEKSNTPGITLEVRFDGGIITKTIPKAEFNPQDGNWHFVVLETNTTPYYDLNMDAQGTNKIVTRLWLDEKRYEIQTEVERVFIGKILLGHHPDTLGTAELGNVLIEDLTIRSKEYSAEEIQHWYYSGQELYNPYDYSFSIT